MTFKHAFTLPAIGGNKLKRFRDWASQHVPELDYRLPPQTPIETRTLTIRLRSLGDIDRVRASLPEALP